MFMNKLYVRKENIGYISYVDSFVNIIPQSKLFFKDKSVSVLKQQFKGSLIEKPLTLTINITGICNFQCLFCFFKKSNKIMTYKTINNILKYIKKNYIYEIDILGGEPLLPDVWPKTKYLLSKLISMNVVKKIYLSTNAYYLDKSKYSLLNNDKIKLSISLESFKHDSNIKDWWVNKSKIIRIIKNVYKFDLFGKKYVITTVISNLNLCYLADFIKSLQSLVNCEAWLWHYPTIIDQNIKFLKHNLSLEDFFSVYKKTIKEYPNILVDAPFTYFYKNSMLPKTKLEYVLTTCKGRYKKIEIMPNGDVYPCALLYKDEFNLGNINIDSYFNLDIIPTNTKCINKSCKYHSFCIGCYGYKLIFGVDDRCPNYL